MKNTKMRKKMLLSSIAMLMVATVSLGSATYAWFSTKTTATAKGIKVQTTQASSLVLSLDQTTWASEIDLGVYGDATEKSPKTLEPGSTADLSNWFAATSTGYDKGTVDPATVTNGTAGTHYVAKDFYAKSIGADLDVDWSMVFAQAQVSTDKNYMRAALNISGDGITGSQKVFWWADGSDESKNGETTSKNTTPAITGVSGDPATVTTQDVTSSTSTTGTLAKLKADKVYTLSLYVWFEGQDLDCKDTRAGTVCDFNLQFTKKVASGS